MKAIECKEFGPVSNLELVETTRPDAARGEVLIEVHAIGLNFPDGLIVQGLHMNKPDRPFIPGVEIAGVVRGIGPRSSRFSVGDRVVGMGWQGGFAEYVSIREGAVFAVPATVSLDAAAASLIVAGTAIHALVDHARIAPEESLLVLGAGGGVGVAAVAIGKLLGARVIAVASSKEKLDLARRQGADLCLNYAEEDLRQGLGRLVGTRAMDVVFDPVGGQSTEAALRDLRWGGRHLIIGFAAGEIPRVPINLLLIKAATMTGVLWGSDLDRRPEHHAVHIQTIMGWLASGALMPEFETVRGLDALVPSLSRVMERRVAGKLVVQIGRSG